MLKKPAASGSSMLKKPAASTTVCKRFVTPVKRCTCGKSLREKRQEPITAVLYDVHKKETLHHPAKNCKYGKTFCYNYVWDSGRKVNTVRLNQVRVLFVSANVAFTLRFLEYHIRLHFRGFVSSRCIAWAAHDCLWERHCVDDRWWKSFNDARMLLIAMKEFQGLEQNR